MYSIYPTFFPAFQCKAGACKHTCCQTWEIDIDPDTEALYRNTPGPLGKELSQWMRTAEDGSTCFKLNEKGYCHFLRNDGLCRLILEKGENYLGNICTMHPRFYKYIGEDIELAGTGLCCERTCEQLQEVPGPLLFLMEGRDEPFSLSDLLCALGFEVSEEDTTFSPTLTLEAIQSMTSHLKQTEPIDDKWTQDLIFMQHHPDFVLQQGKDYLPKANNTYFQKLFQYIWYRQLDLADQIPMDTLRTYAAESTLFIFLTAANTEDPLRAAARWSEQIEYDTDNVEILLEQVTQDTQVS